MLLVTTMVRWRHGYKLHMTLTGVRSLTIVLSLSVLARLRGAAEPARDYVIFQSALNWNIKSSKVEA